MNDINCSEQYLMNQPKLTTFLLLETESNSLTGLVGHDAFTGLDLVSKFEDI